MEKDISTIKVSRYTKHQIKHIQKFLRIKRKKIFISHEDSIKYLIDYVLKAENIDTKTDITENDLRFNEKMIKKHITERDRIDYNLTIYSKVQLKRLIDVLYQLGTTKKKFTYEDMIVHLLNTYIEKYPEMKPYLLEDQYMKQKIAINKLTKRPLGVDIIDDDEKDVF